MIYIPKRPGKKLRAFLCGAEIDDSVCQLYFAGWKAVAQERDIAKQYGPRSRVGGQRKGSPGSGP